MDFPLTGLDMGPYLLNRVSQPWWGQCPMSVGMGCLVGWAEALGRVCGPG